MLAVKHAPSLPARKRFAATHIPGQQRSYASRSTLTTHALPVSQLLSTAVLLAGAWYVSKEEAVAEQDHVEASDRRPCPSCGGSGLTPCFCTKWSDGDVGCNSCNKSGWTKCKSCGGGGMAVPIKVAIRRNDVM